MQDYIDLKDFTVAPVPNELRANYMPYLLMGPDRKQILYVCHTTPAYAMADIVYSRLSKLLGLPCVDAEFGINLNLDNAKYVSITPYHSDWMPYSSWNTVSHIINPLDVEAHLFIIQLTQTTYWNGEILGYITPEGQFIKGDNGSSAFYSAGLQMYLEGDPHWRMLCVDNEIEILDRYSTFMPELKSLIIRLSELSLSEIESCYDFPDDPVFTKGISWFEKILTSTQKIAKEYLTQK